MFTHKTNSELILREMLQKLAQTSLDNQLPYALGVSYLYFCT